MSPKATRRCPLTPCRFRRGKGKPIFCPCLLPASPPRCSFVSWPKLCPVQARKSHRRGRGMGRAGHKPLHAAGEADGWRDPPVRTRVAEPRRVDSERGPSSPAAGTTARACTALKRYFRILGWDRNLQVWSALVVTIRVTQIKCPRSPWALGWPENSTFIPYLQLLRHRWWQWTAEPPPKP